MANQTFQESLIAHCDNKITELRQMQLIYPEELTCLARLIDQWEQTKLRLQPPKG
jgi:hypothetical protein